MSKRSLYSYLIFGLSTLFLASVLPAQTPLLEQLGAAEGLSQGMVYDLIQDHKGFLWFSTKDGINRYDGYTFRVYQNNPFEPFSVSDNEVISLLEDHLGRIWAGTANNGLAVLEPNSGRFYYLNKLSSQSISTIAQTPDGAIWAGTEVAVNRVLVPDVLPSNTPNLETVAKIDTFKWDLADHNSLIPLNVTTDLLTSRDGKLWVSTLRQIGFFDPSTGNYQTLLTNDHIPGSDFVASYFKESPDGSIWTGQHSQLLRFQQQKMTSFPFPEKSVFPYTDLAFDAFGNLFVSTRKTIFRLPASQIATPGHARFELFYRFPLNGIIGSTKLLMDLGGLLWIGTNGYGLRKYNPGNPHFHHYLAGRSHRRILPDALKRVWVWQTGGVFYSLPTPKHPISEAIFKDSRELQHDCLQAKDGSIWLLLENKWSKKRGMLVRLNSQTLLEEARYPIPIKIAISSTLYQDKAGNLWILGCDSELAKFDPEKANFERYDFSGITEFREVSLGIVMDNQGHLWVGTPHGLIHGVPEPSGFKFILHKNKPTDDQTLNCNSILTLLNDPQSPNRYLWVGTKGGGLNRLDKQNGSFKKFTKAEGLPNNVVYGILPDSEGNLWLSTNCGLSKFNVETNVFQNFFNVDGLQDNEFNTLSFARASDGRLYFGGVNGITAFYPSALKSAASAPPVFITRLKINGQYLDSGEEGLQKNIKHSESIELQHNQNQLTFEFAAIDFSTPRMNQYRYRLLGTDKNFLEPTTNNSATYANLSPGDYEFEVLTGGSRGIWGGSPARLKIRILPPWWRSYWAYSLYLIIFALGTWFFYWFQMKKIRLENKLRFEKREAVRLAELDKLKSNFFSSVAHEFRTPITLLLEPARQLMHDTKDAAMRYRLELIWNNARKLLQFVNQLLDLSKLEAGQMPLDLRLGSPVNTVRSVAEQFQPLAGQRSIRLELELPDSTSKFIFDEIKWEQIVSNLLSNAIKFSDNGAVVTLRLTEPESSALTQKKFMLEVADTGSGIAPEDLPRVFDRFFQTEHKRGGTGIGLSLTKDLVELMGGRISVESPGLTGTGTVFRVDLPSELANLEQIESSGQATQANDNHHFVSKFQSPLEDDKGQVPLAKGNRENVSSPLLLLIEDDTELRQFIRVSLPSSYRIAEAANGAEGIQMAFEWVPDLVITDLVMPEKDGFEVVETLKKDPATSQIPIVLLTAKSSFESKMQGLQRGADVYLTKPFRADELIAHVENLLVSRQMLHEHFSKSTLNKTLVESVTLAMPKQENEFLQRLIQVIEDNLEHEGMDADAFARAVFISRSQLHRKISALTGLSLTEFVRNHKLDRAREMLVNRKGSVAEISWRTGFQNTKYFSTCFKERFGVTPSGVLADGWQN
ncbi:MAG: two-component regulator propeller domain-containing protein [Saprospiraceae bacterium]